MEKNNKSEKIQDNKKILNKDFIEIEFTGRIKDGEIFDSNIQEDLEKLYSNRNHEVKSNPFVFCIGEGMFLRAIDDFLTGKEIGKKYEIELNPEKAFGKRNPSLIKIIPMRLFKQQRTPPQPGMMFNFDDQIGKVISVSGGRVITDFNNPLAGKIIIYNLNVKRKVTNIDERIKSLMNFFFRKEFDYKITEKKIIIEAEKPFIKFIELSRINSKMFWS